MPPRMRRIYFGKKNRSGDLLHIEAPGVVVNIQVNLHDANGREVTNVEISPDDKLRGGNWALKEGAYRNRIVKTDNKEDTNLWDSDFARLLAEIAAVGLSREQMQSLRESTDLKQSDIKEILDRAEKAFERDKKEFCP